MSRREGDPAVGPEGPDRLGDRLGFLGDRENTVTRQKLFMLCGMAVYNPTSPGSPGKIVTITSRIVRVIMIQVVAQAMMLKPLELT